MRFAVEAWAPEYGMPTDDLAALAAPEAPPILDVETPVAAWAPRRPPPGLVPASCVLFTDGVRRVEARVWIDIAEADGSRDAAARLGLCASYAAGIVRSWSGPAGLKAEVVAAEVQRGLFTAAPGAEAIATRVASFPVRGGAGDGADKLVLCVQQRMGELEIDLASHAGDADLIVVDGPLRGRQRLANAIGFVKTHHVSYLPPLVEGVVAALGAGERTPIFLTTTSWSRYSWYLRLPGATGHAWAGVVRGEASADLEPGAAAALADLSAATLVRYASRAHKDPRAPQNLYPIAGLERALRHRLGDPHLIHRSLCAAAA